MLVCFHKAVESQFISLKKKTVNAVCSQRIFIMSQLLRNLVFKKDWASNSESQLDSAVAAESVSFFYEWLELDEFDYLDFETAIKRIWYQQLWHWRDSSF